MFLLTGVGFFLTASASAQGFSQSTGLQVIESGMSPGQCIGDSSASLASGNPIELLQCDNSLAQRWLYTGNSLQVFGKCLTAPSMTPGTALVLSDCSGSAGQNWIEQGPNIQLNNTNLCIDLTGGSLSNGTRLQIYTCGGGNSNQNWIFTPAPWTGTLQPSLNKNQCMDDAAASLANGNSIDIFPCNNTLAQTWTYTGTQMEVLGKCLTAPSTSRGTHLVLSDCNGSSQQNWVNIGSSIQLMNTNQCVDVPGGSTANYTQLQLWDCGGSNPNQRWNFSATPQVNFIKLGENQNLCIDDAGASSANGNRIQLFTCNQSIAQSWTHIGSSLQVLGKCLTAPAFTHGSQLQISDCNGSSGQAWVQNGSNIQLANTNQCVDVTGGQIAAGTPLQIWDCGGSNLNQEWTFAARQPSSQQIVTHLNLTSCIDDQGASTSDGNPIQLFSCNRTKAQSWQYDGRTLQVFGKCLTAPSTADGTRLVLSTCNGSTGQSWIENKSHIQLSGTSECIDVPRGSTANGQYVQIYGCGDSNPNQKWDFYSSQVSFGFWSGDSNTDIMNTAVSPNIVQKVGQNPAILMTYVDFTMAFPVDFANRAGAFSSIPMVTWELWNKAQRTDPNNNNNFNPAYSPQAVTNGNFDAYVTQFALAIKAWNKPIFIRFLHEMNGNWYPWGVGGTAPIYDGNGLVTQGRARAVGPLDQAAAWQHVVNIFRTNQVTNVKWVWCPNVGNLNNSSFPGDSYVDWIGIDGYNWGGSGWSSFANIFTSTYQQLGSLSQKPMLVAETASVETGGNKGAWITQTFQTDLLQMPRIKHVTWFNQNDGLQQNGILQDFRIDTSVGSLTAIQQILSQYVFPYSQSNMGF